MRAQALVGAALVAVLGGVGTAEAAPDARNPYHCAFALSVAYDLAKERNGPDSDVTLELRDRYVWQAMRSAMLPHMMPKAGEGDALRAQLAATPETGLAMADNCIRRQDADPRYLASRPTTPLAAGLAGVVPDELDHAALASLFGIGETSRAQ